MLFMRNTLTLFFFVFGLQFPAEASQTFSSGLNKVPLIELYTSEGCSSCPPADLWLSQLKNDERLWKEFVPIAFHVDYWDYIGWKDPFAKRENSLRQRRYRQQGNIKGVYTPGLIFMGQEWRTWYYEKSIPKVEWSQAGDLSVSIDNNVVQIQYNPVNSTARNPAKLKAHMSILGFDLAVDIKRGENQGKILRHEFVNLSHQKIKTTLNKSAVGKFDYHWTLNIPDQFINSKDKLGIAIWISATDSQQPLQSTGAWLN